MVMGVTSERCTPSRNPRNGGIDPVRMFAAVTASERDVHGTDRSSIHVVVEVV